MTIDTKYIRPNITIETFDTGSRFLYIYNYKGVHFRVFHKKDALHSFLENNETTVFDEFNTEAELDNFLKKEMERS